MNTYRIELANRIANGRCVGNDYVVTKNGMIVARFGNDRDAAEAHHNELGKRGRMNTATHTGLPWIEQIMPRGMNDRITADDGEGKTICEFPYGLNADSAFIVKAANAHDDLVKALQAIANGDGIYGAQANEYKQIARSALAKAKLNWVQGTQV